MPASPESKEEFARTVQLAFGRALRAARRRQGLSQERLAFKASLHPSYVAQVERGERNISLRNIWLLAEALELGASDLLSRPGKGSG